MLVYARLAHILKKKFTFDSSTASNAILLGHYYEPRYHHCMNFTKKEIGRVKFPLDSKPPCDCPICSKHTVGHLINNPHLMMLHNIYVLKNFNENMMDPIPVFILNEIEPFWEILCHS